MKRLFQFWLLIFVSVAFLTTIVVSWRIQTSLVERNAEDLLRVNIEDAKNRLDKTQENLVDIISTANSIVLAKARAWAFMVEQDPTILEDQERIEKIARLLDVDEIHASDENGVLIASIPESYKGYHMDSKEQSAEFMRLLYDKSAEIVQEPRAKGINSEFFQYAGVARQDKPGIMQVGYTPQRLRQATLLADPYHIAASFHIGKGGGLRIQKNFASERLTGYVNGEYFRHENVDEVPSVCLSVIYKEYILTASLPTDEIYLPRADATVFLILGNLILFVVVFFLVSELLQRVVVNSVCSVNDSLARITSGLLDEKVKIDTTPEFIALSKGVNATVYALKQSIESEAKRIDSELEMGRAIQRSVLPTNFPVDENIQLVGSLVTAKEVGGDFYDFFYLDDDRIVMEIADVSGKGVAAALFMMSAKALIHESIQSGGSLEQAIARANAELCRGNSTFMFLTAFFVVLNLKTGEATCVDAGHNPPLLKRGNGKWEYFHAEPNLILGVDEDATYSSVTFQLQPGDRFFMYTDGVSEAMNLKQEPWGEERLQQALDATYSEPIAMVLDDLQNSISLYVDGAPQSDDITKILFQYR